MAFILPDGVIQFMQYDGDKNYNHSLIFDMVEIQTAHFDAEVKREFTAQSYSRYSKNSIRVSALSDEIIRYNYMRFRNTSFNNKWFYAFIDRVEYVSNNVCEVFFTIDVIQTWWFNFTFGQCFVEREHTKSDYLGQHLVPENLEGGDYIINTEELIRLNGTHYVDGLPISGLAYIILATETYTVDGNGNRNWSKVGSIINGIPLPFGKMIAPLQGSLFDIINNYNADGKIDSIVTIIATRNYGDSDSSHVEAFQFNKNLDVLFEGYTPKNNKLYTYPYCMITVDNGLGQTGELKYELFNSEQIAFNLINSYLTSSSCLLVPLHYRGIAIDYDSGVPFDQYPDIPYTKEVYSTWLAQNRNQVNASIQNAMLGNIFSGSVGMLGSISSPASIPQTVLKGGESVAGSILSQETTVRSVMAKIKDVKAFPPQVSSHGNQSAITLANEVDRFGFSIKRVSIKESFAKLIDDFFTMYGYQVNELKYPTIEDPYGRRPRWNYLKTNGCVIHPVKNNGLPADVEQTICDIFDKGITFWTTPQTIGDYSGDNSPQGD